MGVEEKGVQEWVERGEVARRWGEGEKGAPGLEGRGMAAGDWVGARMAQDLVGRAMEAWGGAAAVALGWAAAAAPGWAAAAAPGWAGWVPAGRGEQGWEGERRGQQGCLQR